MNARRRGLTACIAIAAVLEVSAVGAEDASTPRYADGALTFQANCAVCHRATGAGQPGLAPPLLSYPARYLERPEGRRQLVLTVLFGMFGDIVVDEKHYNFKMPEFARFDDTTIAGVLNFVAFDLGHAPPTSVPLAPDDVARERVLALTGEAVRRHRFEALDAPAP